MDCELMGSINHVDVLVLDKRTEISFFLDARREVWAYRWLVEKQENALRE